MQYPSTSPKLVIFDCDGVLVDSEPIFNRVLHEFLRSCGAGLSFSECCDLFIGKSMHDVERYLSNQGIIVPENWSANFYELALEALIQEITPIQGARGVLHKLMCAEVPFCVASNGSMAMMYVTLERTEMLPWFEGNMFSAYEVGLSKPAPDVFLHAAKINGIRPEHCVVIEDSASGFEAAANAGMNCFAYIPKETKPVVDLYGARQFCDMGLLPEMLGIT